MAYPSGKGYPKGTKGSRAKRRSASVPGQPGIVKLQQNWPVRFGHRFKMRSIRTLIKSDPAIDKAARAKRTDVAGIDTGDSGGFKGGVRTLVKGQMTPTAHAQTKVKAPVNSGGKKVGGSRAPSNAKSRFGRGTRR